MDQDLAEIDRQLNNPLTSLWSLVFQYNLQLKRGDLIDGTAEANVLNFQPALPIPVGQDIVLIARPVFPLLTQPVLDPRSPDGVEGHVTGMGDIQLLSLVGPSRSSGLVWGAGATFKFPTASKDRLGEGKYQAGPAVMLFSLGKQWTLGATVQHWWSYAGDEERRDTSQTNVGYAIVRRLPDAWSVGMTPTVTINWEANSHDRLTLPIGFGVTKTTRVGKMPVKFALKVQYSVVRPDSFGTEWNFRFQVIPVIRSPFQ